MQYLKQLIQRLTNNSLERFCRSGYSRLKQAVLEGDTEMMLECRRRNYPTSEAGQNILQVAVQQAQPETVKAVLELFPTVKLEDKTPDGDTPLMQAVLGNKLEVARLLVVAGANVNTRENEGSTPLIAAAAGGFVEVLQLLVEAGANLDSRNFQGQTALHRACFYGELATVRYLVKHTPLRLSTCDRKGNNCVHLAAMGLSMRCLRYLQKKAADRSIFEQRNQESMTPHDILLMRFEFIRERQVPPVSMAAVLQYLKQPKLAPAVTQEQYNGKGRPANIEISVGSQDMDMLEDVPEATSIAPSARNG